MQDKQQTPEFEEYNASLDPDPSPADMTADELQENILADSDMNGFQKFIARMDEKTWTIAQRVVGAILGLGAGAALFWNGGSHSEQGFSYSLIIAVVVAMLVPNILEKQGGRRIPKLRIALVIALAAVIVGYFIYWGSVHGFRLTES